MQQPQQITIHSLTRNYSGLARVIHSPVEIFNTRTGQKESTHGIWDTGATGSAITKILAQRLGLLPISQTNVKGVHGTKTVNVYAVKIVLNNQNVSFLLPVTECDQLSDDDSACFLIGMDVISRGDFAVSNVNNQTTMTFRVPSIHRFDFVQETSALANQQKAISRKAERDSLYKPRKK